MGSNPYNIGGDNQDNSGMAWDVLTTIIICLALALVVCLATGCGTQKEYIDREKIVYRDTTAWRDSIITVPIPLGRDQAIVSIKDTSKLETQVATSIAYVSKDGQIHHTLENKPVTVEAIVKIPSRTIWTNITSEKERTVIKTEWRDKPLSWWKSFQIRAFWWLLGAVVALLLYVFRKPILALISTIMV